MATMMDLNPKPQLKQIPLFEEEDDGSLSVYKH